MEIVTLELSEDQTLEVPIHKILGVLRETTRHPRGGTSTGSYVLLKGGKRLRTTNHSAIVRLLENHKKPVATPAFEA